MNQENGEAEDEREDTHTQKRLPMDKQIFSTFFRFKSSLFINMRIRCSRVMCSITRVRFSLFSRLKGERNENDET